MRVHIGGRPGGRNQPAVPLRAPRFQNLGALLSAQPPPPPPPAAPPQGPPEAPGRAAPAPRRAPPPRLATGARLGGPLSHPSPAAGVSWAGGNLTLPSGDSGSGGTLSRR